MDGAHASWLSVFSAWFFCINAIVCIALIVAVVRVEKKHRYKIKKLEDALDDPAVKDMLVLRLRIKDILKKHGVDVRKSATSKAETE